MGQEEFCCLDATGLRVAGSTKLTITPKAEDIASSFDRVGVTACFVRGTSNGDGTLFFSVASATCTRWKSRGWYERGARAKVGSGRWGRR